MYVYLEPLWDLQTRVFLKMLGHIIQTYSQILSSM